METRLEGQARTSLTRRDAQWDATRVALIEAAEFLIGELGFDAVSTRRIQERAGSANKNAVCYYFGNKAALVSAIHQHRLPAMERRRAVLLDELDRAGQGHDLERLIEVFWRPYLEQVDAEGRHSYVRLLMKLSLGREKKLLRADVDRLATQAIVGRIIDALPRPIGARFFHRLRCVFVMTVLALDAVGEAGADHGLNPEELFLEAVRMAVAAMSAPASLLSDKVV
jgi:AcrR family transcriptional regulator